VDKTTGNVSLFTEGLKRRTMPVVSTSIVGIKANALIKKAKVGQRSRAKV
jgi:hypothetical protein